MKYTYMNHIKGKKYMEDNFFDSVKTLFTGILIMSSSFLFKSFIPSLLEDEELASTSDIISMIDVVSLIIPILGMIVIVTGMIKFVNYVRCGGDYYSSSSIFDKELEEYKSNDNENEENEDSQLVEDDLETMVSVDAMLIKNKETLDRLSKLNKDSYIKDTTQNETFSKNNDTPKIEYIPKQKSVQMVKCSFCGREKEMGSVCKRCKKC